MRAIEFRAWHTRLQEMEYITDLYWFEENFCHHNGDNDYVIMQYTGLKDAKGNKVYEGDVLARDGFPNAEVYFHGLRWYPAIDPEHHIVIGNKYQHGELLNEQQTANIGTDRDG